MLWFFVEEPGKGVEVGSIAGDPSPTEGLRMTIAK